MGSLWLILRWMSKKVINFWRSPLEKAEMTSLLLWHCSTLVPVFPSFSVKASSHFLYRSPSLVVSLKITSPRFTRWFFSHSPFPQSLLASGSPNDLYTSLYLSYGTIFPMNSVNSQLPHQHRHLTTIPCLLLLCYKQTGYALQTKISPHQEFLP